MFDFGQTHMQFGWWRCAGVASLRVFIDQLAEAAAPAPSVVGLQRVWKLWLDGGRRSGG